jgi:hypothetical protein
MEEAAIENKPMLFTDVKKMGHGFGEAARGSCCKYRDY